MTHQFENLTDFKSTTFRLIVKSETPEEERAIFDLTMEASQRNICPHFRDGAMYLEFVKRDK
jgi:hypothetical protein